MSISGNHLEIVIITTGAVSIFSSICVILTYVWFREMRSKRFMQFIVYISLSDLVLNITTCFGFPTNNHLCFAQTLIALLASMSSWLWTAALSFTMFTCVNGWKSIPDIYLQLFCWLVPVAVTVINLSVNTIVRPTPADTWCQFVPRRNTSTIEYAIVSYTCFWMWLFFSVLVMIICGALVHYKLFCIHHADNNVEDTTKAKLIYRMYRKVRWYPVFIVACWIVNFLVVEFGRDDSNLEAFFGMFAGSCNAICTAAIFFVNSEEARRRWYDYFYPNKREDSLMAGDVPIDFETEEMYRESSISLNSGSQSIISHPFMSPSITIHPSTLNVGFRVGQIQSDPFGVASCNL